MLLLKDHLYNDSILLLCSESFRVLLSCEKRPFLSRPKPLFQSEANFKAIEMKMIFYFHANKTHFHKTSFALCFILKVRVFGTLKWPTRALVILTSL